MEKKSVIPEVRWTAFIGLLVLVGLFLVSRYNYLLFHVLAEFFSIIIGCTIFMVAWNSRRIINNNFLLFLGIAYLFVAFMDMIHMLSYKGMGVMQEGTANVPTQLWIAARYIESLSLLIAFLFLNKRINYRLVFTGYGTLIPLVLGSIYYWKVFPDCYIEGTGLSPFKIYSEYIISLILLASVFLLFRKKDSFDRAVFKLLAASLVTTILSELCFTFYIDVYGFSNLAGHFLKIISFFLIYKAIIEKGLMDPYILLFRDLTLSIEAHKRSEEKYHNLADTSLAGICISDIEGNLIFINDTLARMLEYASAEEMMKLPAASIYKNSNTRTDFYKKLKRDRNVDNIEMELLTRSGQTINTMVNAKLENDTISKVVIDITGRKRVEEELLNELKLNEALAKVSNSLLSPELAIINIANIVLQSAKKLTDSEHGYVSTIDSVTKDMVCHTHTNMINMTCNVTDKDNKIIFPANPDGSYPRIWGISLNEKQGFYTNDPSNHKSFIGIPDGHIPLKNFLSIPAITGGNLVGQIALANSRREYTDRDLYIMSRIGELYSIALQRKQMEEELASHRRHLMTLVEERTHELEISYKKLESEFAIRKRAEKQTRLMALFTELNPSPVLRFDIEGRILMANRAAIEILDINPQHNTFIKDILHSVKDLDITECIRQGRILSMTEQVGTNYYYFTIKGIPEHEIGHIYGSDISGQKKAESDMIRASQLALMGEVAACVAHEINNPINGIINYTQILANRSGPGSNEHEIAERIIKEGKRIAGIVRDLLFFTSRDKGEMQPVQIHAILSDSLTLINSQLKKDSITLTVSVPPGLPAVIAHHQQIEQVFLNILSNARYALNRKYEGPDTEKVLEIHCEEALTDDQTFIRTVFYDKGIGISKGILNKLTDSFFSTKPVGEGTGLGLSISNSIVANHGGSLVIESSEGEFTRVIVDLPAATNKPFNNISSRENERRSLLKRKIG